MESTTTNKMEVNFSEVPLKTIKKGTKTYQKSK
jgi:hypothetical protein